MEVLWQWIIRLVFILPLAFWIWMLVDCVREEEDRSWYFILFFTYILGAIVYLIFRKIPRRRGQVPAPSFLKKLLGRKKLMELEAAAKRIGNAYQFLNWGNALFSMNDYKKALLQFDQAIELEETLTEAWWMKARCETRLHKWEEASKSYAFLFKLDAEYAYGESSLNYGRLLLRLKQTKKAQEVLEKHMERFRLPEALYLLAEIYMSRGNKQPARDLLETVITDVQSAPGFHMRKQKKWMNKAKVLLALNS